MHAPTNTLTPTLTHTQHTQNTPHYTTSPFTHAGGGVSRGGLPQRGTCFSSHHDLHARRLERAATRLCDWPTGECYFRMEIILLENERA